MRSRKIRNNIFALVAWASRAKRYFWRLQSKSALCVASDNNVPGRPFICIVLRISSEAASTVKNRVMLRKCFSRSG